MGQKSSNKGVRCNMGNRAAASAGNWKWYKVMCLKGVGDRSKVCRYGVYRLELQHLPVPDQQPV